MARKSQKSRRQKDLDPKGGAKGVTGGNDQENLTNSWNNITKRDIPNVTRTGTMGVVKVTPGKGASVKPFRP